MQDTDLLTNLDFNNIFHFKVRIVGGKGGFGATLKSQKPKHAMTENFEACRDLSGRRIRHVTAQRQLEEWQKKKEEEDKKIEEELDSYKKQEKQMNAAIHANTYKIDEKYKAQMDRAANNISNSVMLGKNKLKRKHEDLAQMQKPNRFEKLVNGISTSPDYIDPQEDIDEEDLFFSSNSRKLKRFKINEDLEKSAKDDHNPQDTEEPCLMVPQEPEPESLMIKQDEVDEAPEPEKIPNSEIDEKQEKDLPIVSETPKVEQSPEKDIDSVLKSLESVDSVETLKKKFTLEQVKDSLTTLG